MNHIYFAKSLLITGKESQIKVHNPFDLTQHIIDTVNNLGGGSPSNIDAVNGLSFLNSPVNTQIGLGGQIITDTVINGGNFNLELNNLQGLFFEGLGWITSHLEVELKGTNNTTYLGDIRINSNLTDLRYSQTGVGQSNIQIKPTDVTISIEDTNLSTLSTYNLPKNEPESGDVILMDINNQLIFRKNYQTFSTSQRSTGNLTTNDRFSIYIPIKNNQNFVIESVTVSGINTLNGGLKIKYDVYRQNTNLSLGDFTIPILVGTNINNFNTPRTITVSELLIFSLDTVSAALSDVVLSVNGYYIHV